MLERIETIKGIGLLHEANGKPYKFQRATLVYADNGRGKSTLATILRSVATNEAKLIDACKTVDGDNTPEVVLQFDSGHKITFKNGEWSEARPGLMVFDADFIGRNVHSGGEVSTDHRRCLLEFALGEAAVAARKEVDLAAADSRAAAQRVQRLEQEIAGFHVGISQGQFQRLPQITDIDLKISDLQKRILAANNITAIQAREVPSTASEPAVDINALFTDLASSLRSAHEDAEKLVRQHIAKLGSKEAESWLGQGQQFGNGSSCPYCDQDISNSGLVHAYQTHFDVAYANLKRKVADLNRHVAAGIASSTIDGFSRDIELAAARASAWTEHLSIPTISFDRTKTDAAMTAFRKFVMGLVRSKQLAPTEPIGCANDEAKAVELWEQTLAPFRAANNAVTAANGLIGTYKAQLNGESVPELQKEFGRLNLTKLRYDAKVVDLFSNLAAARACATSADTSKRKMRENLDALMNATLSKYQVSINNLLLKFGASFSIKGMGANFRGNAPRAEYGLLLRGKSVAVEGGTPPFAMALSEGDKRTLAFAFFVASTLEDLRLANRIVVIDDPMCSLDMNRRQHTRAVLRKIGSTAEQLIVLAHDAYFLRDLRNALSKDDKATPIALCQLAAVSYGYTDFGSFDVDKECESRYTRCYRLLSNFLSGQGGDPREVAQAIRVMLEGYLHRRFPGLLGTDLMFGQIVAVIRDAVSPSPLCHAQNLVDELNEINDYAGQFHHDTNTGADTVVITAAELKTYVNRALTVVHKGAPVSPLV